MSKVHAIKAEEHRPGETDERVKARTMAAPTVNAAMTLTKVLNDLEGGLELPALVTELHDQVQAVADGSLKRPEAYLVAQAATLDALFNKLTRRAVDNIGHYPETVQLYLRLALKAQAQATRTIEVLNEMKNPRPVAFVAQANVAHGPQQVVNTQPGDRRGRGKAKNRQSKLTGGNHGNRVLDTRATGKAGRSDPALEAVGAINRPTDA